ncbi:hypothetical protein LDO26_03115 [Luteimonas sp. BDR2-5]|uniref:hypothetical protein n=1 Tax=Proluteimonas luteida TaxID=2878685 RepID=UPI001E430971|nr:hypothetical protein [Luteimonas sp. BDR2-5]MCD9027204.1 hypothetical protein [Luteimonas sp. BDR2-5]
MSELKPVQSALGWCLFALVLVYVPINLIGFASPFVGHLRAPDDPDASMALLRTWQPFAPWLSLAFLLPGWWISRTLATPLARGLTLLASILVPCAYVARRFAIGTGLAPEATPAQRTQAMFVEGAADLYVAFAGFLFLLLLWRAVRRLRAATPTAPATVPVGDAGA